MVARARDMGSFRNNHNNDNTLHLEKRAVAIPEPVEPTTKPKPKPPATPAKPKPSTTAVPPPVKPPPVTTATITTPPLVTEPTSTTATSSIEPTTPVVPGNSNGNDPASTTAGGPGTGAIVGIVAGVAVVLALIVGLVFWNRRKKRRGEEVYKAELYQQQRMMSDNSSVLASGRVPHHQRFNSSSGLGTASATAGTVAGAGSRNSGVVGVGKRGMGGEGDRESLSEDYRQQQEHYYQQQPEWFAKKSPLEYYSQVPPIEQLQRGVGRKESDNSLNDGMSDMGGPGDKDEIELQLAGPSTSSAPGQGVSEIMAARSLQASTMQHNLQQQHLQQQQLQQNPFQAQQQQLEQQQQQQQQYDRESTPLNSTDAGQYNEPAKVIPRQQPTRQQQQLQQQQHQQQQRQHSRAESNPPHSGHLPPIQLHSPMGSVYHDPAQTPTNSSYHPVPPMPSRPNSFYNVGNILNAAGESITADDYAEVDMTPYYRPPPPVAPTTPSGFYDFDVDSYSNDNNPPLPPTNGPSFTGGAGVGTGVPERSVGIASPPPIPRATRPASLSPTSNTANNNSNSRAAPPTPMHPYLPPPLPTVSTNANPVPSQSAEGAILQSPVSPTSGPLVGGRTPRSIHGSGGRRV
ncbi:hypothetical protein BGZ97_007942 [Linnemannia gamsii]|uniref:Uncharacterized protein n=1 Tax=Linnemannia gamsii TaxID=64522 RepID=A0A9P6QSH5_9FUNG|nr:hypothetical protein BGZ97_007942 [Linnemannia gamsii]